MERNDILELTRLMQEGGGLENDLGEVMELFRKTIEKKYVTKIHAAARARQEQTIEHPPKEVTLLRAMRAFTSDAGRTQMDGIIQAMLLMNTVQNINSSVAALTAKEPGLLQAMSAGDSQQTDALEVLPTQNAQLTGLLMTLALTDVI